MSAAARALRQAHRALRPDGVVLLVEFAVADQLAGNLHPWGRLAEVAGEAGFDRVARVPVTDPTSLVLALHRS